MVKDHDSKQQRAKALAQRIDRNLWRACEGHRRRFMKWLGLQQDEPSEDQAEREDKNR